MIEIRKLYKKYHGKAALKNVNLDLPRGQIIGLFGENGAGKTTLMKSILGFVSFEGSITLDGEAIDRRNIAKLSFATAEHSFFPDLTARDHAKFYRDHFEKYSEKRFMALMDFFNLPLDKTLKRFSLGQKNQFEVIMALSQGADYILMDEPFAGNDVFNREDFYKVLLGILREDETVILSTHLIEEVSGFVDRAILIRSGEIVGDVSVSELDDEGVTLIDYIKRKYEYRADRVSKALDELREEDEE